ncbi:MAG: hypothetical protein IKN27_00705 [Selenomonadaceae bacterium]|nr:hypothetical protein [Selenomonadaceae bacterium]
MEIYDEYYDKFFPWIKIVGIGATGAAASNYFGAVADEIFPARLILSDKAAVADSRDKISDFIAGCEWLFVITDVENLDIAETFAKSIEESKKLPTARVYDEFKLPLMTFLILSPSVDDVRLADIPKNFGAWIILPQDKIAEIGLTNDEMIYRAVNMSTSIIPIMKRRDNLIGMDFAEIPRTLENVGKIYVGFGESLDAENNSLAAVKKALKSPLFLEDISKAKTVWFVFFGKVDFISMLEIHKAVDFFAESWRPECGAWIPDDDEILFQLDPDESFADGVTAFILATNFVD